MVAVVLLIGLIVVHIFTHHYNGVRGHRTGSNKSGAEDYLRRKTNKNPRQLLVGLVIN